MAETHPNAPRRTSLKPLLLILAGGAALVAIVRWLPTELVHSFSEANRFLATSAAVLLTCGLAEVWFLYFSGVNRRIKVRVVTLQLLIAAGVAASLKFEGFTGNMEPIFSWRWWPKEVAKTIAEKPADTTTVETDFSQFLGPDRTAILPAAPLALDWSAQQPRTVWRQPIGAGWSSFAIVGDYAVTQEQHDLQELVVCYRRSTGEVIWTHSDEARHDTALGGLGPRATPTIHQGRVYTLGATGILNALDGATGKPVWPAHDIVKEHGATLPDWGKSGSPLIVDDLIVVSAGGPNGYSLVAYHKDTGKLAWHAGDDKSSYASPMLATLAGRRQIVMVNADSVTGHDPQSGKVLWRYSWPGNMPKVPQPVQVADDRLFISAGYGLGCQILTIKGDGDARSATPLWPQDNKQLKPKFTNVVVRDGFVYGLDDGIAMVCLELATGKRKWKAGRYGHGQLLLVGDVILVQAEDGRVALVEANPQQHRELTQFPALADKTWNNPVLSGRYLLVRNGIEAACYELPTR